jgi:hypothetical protein
VNHLGWRHSSAPRQTEVQSQSYFNDISVRSFIPSGAPSLSMAMVARFLFNIHQITICATRIVDVRTTRPKRSLQRRGGWRRCFVCVDRVHGAQNVGVRVRGAAERAQPYALKDEFGKATKI